MLRVHGVERLHHRPSELLRDPLALRRAVFDRGDAAVSLGIVVAGVDDDCPVPRREQILRQIADALFGDGDDHQVPAARRVAHSDWLDARLCRQSDERLWSSRIGDGDVVPKRAQAARECAADMTRTDDADLHERILRGRASITSRRCRKFPAAGDSLTTTATANYNYLNAEAQGRGDAEGKRRKRFGTTLGGSQSWRCGVI